MKELIGRKAQVNGEVSLSAANRGAYIGNGFAKGHFRNMAGWSFDANCSSKMRSKL
jgi:hypothetical protein